MKSNFNHTLSEGHREWMLSRHQVQSPQDCMSFTYFFSASHSTTMRPISPQKHQEALRLLEDGYTTHQVEAAVGISRSTVSKL